MKSAKNMEATKRVCALFSAGHSYESIGREFGFSRQRAQQLVRPSAGLFKELRNRAKDKCERCGRKLRLGDGHGHHKTRTGEFNKLSNLEYLCRGCHTIADRDKRVSARSRSIGAGRTLHTQ